MPLFTMYVLAWCLSQLLCFLNAVQKTTILCCWEHWMGIAIVHNEGCPWNVACKPSSAACTPTSLHLSVRRCCGVLCCLRLHKNKMLQHIMSSWLLCCVGPAPSSRPPPLNPSLQTCPFASRAFTLYFHLFHGGASALCQIFSLPEW